MAALSLSPPALSATADMSVFEAKVVLTLLKNSTAIPPLEKNMFEKHWTASVNRVVLLRQRQNLLTQLEYR